MQPTLSRLLIHLITRNEDAILTLTEQISTAISRVMIPAITGKPVVHRSLVNCMWVNGNRVDINIPLNQEDWGLISLQAAGTRIECTIRYPCDAYRYIYDLAHYATKMSELDEVWVKGYDMGPLKWCHVNAACALHFAGVDWRYFYDGWVSGEIQPAPFLSRGTNDRKRGF